MEKHTNSHLIAALFHWDCEGKIIMPYNSCLSAKPQARKGIGHSIKSWKYAEVTTSE